MFQIKIMVYQIMFMSSKTACLAKFMCARVFDNGQTANRRRKYD